MEYRVLGKTGYQVSTLSFGTWAIGGSWGTAVDERIAEDALRFAVDQGVNFFDTADVYGGGRAETLLGQAFGANPDILIATKFCRAADIQDPETYSYARVRQFAEQSLARLKREAIDLYQIHCPPTWVIEQGEVFSVLDRLVEDGLVRAYGVSVETVEEGHLAMRYPGVSALQVIFNIFRQKPLESLLPAAEQNSVGILARVPLASGLLTGKFQTRDTFSVDDHRHFNRDGEAFNVGETFAGLPFAKGVELANQLRWIQDGRGSMAAAALRWIIDQPGVTTAIPGFKNSQQVASNLVALKAKSFSPEELERLRAFYHSAVAEHIRGPY
jgi:aryl-alcohol dehydrogenase-like predicted oxidoreductase